LTAYDVDCLCSPDGKYVAAGSAGDTEEQIEKE